MSGSAIANYRGDYLPEGIYGRLPGEGGLPWESGTPPAEIVKEAPGPPEAPADAKPASKPDKVGDQLWLRRWRLTIGSNAPTAPVPEGDYLPEGIFGRLPGEDGLPEAGAAPEPNALDLSALAFEFRIEQNKTLVPWPMELTIYNPDDDILVQMQKEMTHVVLEAGYEGSSQYGTVFSGKIVYYRHGRKDATDTFIEIHAIQWDQPLSAAVVNQWLPANYVRQDVVDAITAVMAPYGVTLGQITDLGGEKSPRGRALYGMASDVLRDVARRADAEVWIGPDGKLHMLKYEEFLQMQTETVPILGPKTGLIGVPTQSMGAGLEIRSLLNPRILPGGQVKVDMRHVTAMRTVDAGDVWKTNQQLSLGNASLSADGFYTAEKVVHSGQNRGNPWYTDVTTRPIDPNKIQTGVRSSI